MRGGCGWWCGRSLRVVVVGGLFGSVLAREEDMLAWTEPNRPPDRPRLSEIDNGELQKMGTFTVSASKETVNVPIF